MKKIILNNEELNFIRNNYGMIKISIICEKLNISQSKLYSILKELNLKRDETTLICNKVYRNCPNCGNEITYKSGEYRQKAEKKNSVCRKCDYESRKTKYFGESNPFYGKKHSEEFKNKLSNERKGKHMGQKIVSLKGEKASMYGKSIYSVWVEKYGKDIADQKMIEFKKKQSFNNSGEKNAMYGKPSPQGSGNGWSGWYKEWFFRSLRELSYMINVIERFNLRWETGENKNLKIKYIDFEGKERNYFADFLINDKFLVEIKPKKLWNSINIQLKKDSAIMFCNKNDLKYKLIDCDVLTFEKIKQLKDNGIIKFTDKYEIKFNNYINEKG